LSTAVDRKRASGSIVQRHLDIATAIVSASAAWRCPRSPSSASAPRSWPRVGNTGPPSLVRSKGS